MTKKCLSDKFCCSGAKTHSIDVWMNSTEFKLRRLGLGLSVSGMAAFCAVSERMVMAWEQGDDDFKAPEIPEKVQSKLYCLDLELAKTANKFVCDEIDDMDCNVLVFFNSNEDYHKYGDKRYPDVQLYNFLLLRIIDECQSIIVDYHVMEFDAEDFEQSRQDNPSLTVRDWAKNTFNGHEN